MEEMRKVYAKTVELLYENDKNVFALEADLSSSMSTGGLKEKLGNNYINVGIMEANMIGIASGLNLCGGYAFVHSFGQFIARRAYDQLFISLAYAGCNACLVGSDAGVSAEHNGGTHMTFEDMGIIRNIPNIYIYDVCDPLQLKKILEDSYNNKRLVYIRTFRKAGKFSIYNSIDEIGDGATLLKDKGNITLIATGLAVHECIEAAKKLEDSGINVKVIDVHRIKPLNEKFVLNVIENDDVVITCENHSINNGLGSTIAELLSEKCPKKLVRLGVNNRFGQVGTLDYLLKDYNFDSDYIVNTIKSLKNNKNY